jgi:hypothetical protein
MLEDTGNDNLDFTRIGFWLLAEGEWDGLDEMWDTGLGRLLYQNENDNLTQLHFHPGCDSVVGSGQVPVSTGNDQGVDAFWLNLLSGQQVLHYNRWAYYAIQLKQLINNPPNQNQNDSTVWADINPIGLWRTTRCRLFDDSGNMTGYAFSRNAVWQYVDLLCRRKLFPEYLIDSIAGAQDLPAAVKARFDWSALADSAAYFDEILPSTGRPRFTSDVSFTQQTTLQACVTQLLTNCRSYQRERSGKFSIVADRPRASVFHFSRQNSDSFTHTDADLKAAPNTYVSNFKDLLAPAFATIASINAPDLAAPVVTTVAPHCATGGDYVLIGKTGTKYDTYWQVDSVPAPDGLGNVYQMTLKSRGSNYPAAVGSVGGLIGFRYSRFKARSPQFQHKAHQLAKGAVGIGIPRQRNRVLSPTDFANSTWDQVARVSNWQRAVALGPDVQPYISPIAATLKAPLFAEDVDGSGALAILIEPGDIVAIDDTLTTTYAGLYEVMKTPITLLDSSGVSGDRTPVAGSVELSLRPYSDANYPDDVPFAEPGWPDVPLLPGGTTGTIIPLADGEAIFFTGTNADSESFQMPSGFSQANMICWASPQGFVDGQAHLHYVTDCDAYATRKLAMIYNDGSGTEWVGDVNWCAIAWRTKNSATVSTVTSSGANPTPFQFVELTLLGGEKIIFGKGLGGVVIGGGPNYPPAPLPAGYTGATAVALAFPKQSYEVGSPTQGVGAFVQADGTVLFLLNDDNGNQWPGSAQTMIFAFQNNMATWNVMPNGWFYCPLPNGQTLAIGGFSIWDARAEQNPGLFRVQPTNITLYPVPETGANLGQIPVLAGMPSATLEVMTGPNGFQLNGGGHPAHGVKQCFVDGDNSYCSFEDGEGNIWYGSSGVFGLLCDTATAALGGTPVSANPTSPWLGTSGSGTSGSGGSGSGGSGGSGSGGSGDTGSGGSGGGGTAGGGSPGEPGGGDGPHQTVQ